MSVYFKKNVLITKNQTMRIVYYAVVSFTAICIFLTSCITEKEYCYNVGLKNTSNSDIEVTTYILGELESQFTLETNSSCEICNYCDNTTFTGLGGYECPDSIIIRFDNHKGYIDFTMAPEYSYPYSFENDGTMFINSTKYENEGDYYYFVITESDYNNAHELPE